MEQATLKYNGKFENVDTILAMFEKYGRVLVYPIEKEAITVINIVIQTLTLRRSTSASILIGIEKDSTVVNIIISGDGEGLFNTTWRRTSKFLDRLVTIFLEYDFDLVKISNNHDQIFKP